MAYIKKAPLSQQGQNHKGTVKIGNKSVFCNPIRDKIFRLFSSGGKYSVAELSRLLNIPDPRSHIRYIRMAGYPIADYWEHSKFSKYKVYFMKGGRNE